MNLIPAIEIAKQSWQIYKNNFTTFLSVTIWLLPFVIITSLMESNQSISGLYFIVTILSIAASLAVSIIVIEASNAFYNNQPVNIKEAVNPAIRRMGSYLWIAILNALIVIAGLIILIIPGIIFAIWYSLAEQVFVLENVKGYSALKRSKELVTGYWWAILWRWLAPSILFGIIIALISAVIFLPIILFTDFNAYEAFLSTNQKPSLFESLYSGILGIIVTPLFTTIGVIIYNNVKQLKEASSKDQSAEPAAVPQA